MSIIFRVLYAAHANGTHHKLALCALPLLACHDAEAWQRVFLLHAEAYLAGAKAPDDEFKDFKNHVLHPRDGYWGGAPEKVAEWFDRTRVALQAGDWPNAAYSAGVLSHYLTDPLHPFHTAQSDAETHIHRAVEWSINRSFDDLYRTASSGAAPDAVPLAEGQTALKELVCLNADRSNEHYETLIAHYDIKAGVSDPPAGLDKVSRRIVGELLHKATRSLAVVLDRAIEESGATAPQVSLTLPTILSMLRIPKKLLEKRLTDAADRKLVTAMYDELMATGKVVKNLPDDDRVVRDLYRQEIAEPKLQRQAEARSRRITALADRSADTAETSGLSSLTLRPGLAELVPPPLPAEPTERRPYTPSISAADATALMAAVAASNLAEPQSPERLSERLARATPRVQLVVSDGVEQAPSIGAKTASRLAAAGITTVGELLAADPSTLAVALGTKHISARDIADWQDQARLVCAVPGLHGGGAQLLVAAGYRSVEAIANAAPETLCADVLKMAQTDAGQRILREGQPPDIERIKNWAAKARAMRAA